MTHLRWIPTRELLLSPRRSRRLYPSDLQYLVSIETPNGDHIEFECWASDSEEASILACESLIPEWGATTEDVSQYVGTPQRIRRSA